MSTVISTKSDSATQTKCPSTATVKTIQIVRCPMCGSPAERSLRRDRQTSSGEYSIQTACPTCDYFMVMSSLTGKVLEAHFSGQISA